MPKAKKSKKPLDESGSLTKEEIREETNPDVEGKNINVINEVSDKMPPINDPIPPILRTERYDISRGLAIIFNFHHFNDIRIIPRHEYKLDVRQLKEILPVLGFPQILIEENLSSIPTLRYHQKLLQQHKELAETSDCLCIFILAYRANEDGRILTRDGAIDIAEFFSKFSEENIPIISGKPILFFVDCREYKIQDNIHDPAKVEGKIHIFNPMAVSILSLSTNLPSNCFVYINPYELFPSFKNQCSTFIATISQAIKYFENELKQIELIQIINKINELLFEQLSIANTDWDDSFRRENYFSKLNNLLYFSENTMNTE